MSAAIQIRPLDAVMGAEVTGADLARPIDALTFERFEEALERYKVLVFRDQHLTKKALLAFSRLWGPVGEHILPGAVGEDYAELNVTSNEGPDGKPSGKHPDPGAKRWHTDKSYMPKPALATLLYGVKVPSDGGDTLFANATMAYEALPDAMKRRIEGLSAIHWVEHSRRTGGRDGATDYELKRAPPVVHPLVRVHPATGERSLYCGCHAWKIDGLPEAEGRALLDALMEFAAQQRFVYRHKWRANDLVIWDNRCTFHAATDYDAAKELRVMYRTVIEGEAAPLAAV